ncbi:MAG: hypothetical protein ABH950_08375 [Candidatus Altiarchaeota archaeon]
MAARKVRRIIPRTTHSPLPPWINVSLLGSIKDLKGDISDQVLQTFPYLPLDEQIELYDAVRRTGKTPERELLRVSENTPHEFENSRGNPQCPMDQTLRKVRKGHIVMVEHEVSQSGINRTQAGFLSEVVADSLTDSERVNLLHFPEELKHLQGADLSDPKVAAEVKRQLLESALNDPMGSRPFSEADKHSILFGLSDDNYRRKIQFGIVKEPPSAFNDGQLRLSGDVGIDMSNTRLIHIIGIDEVEARESRDWAQLEDRIEVLYKDHKWYPGTVIDVATTRRGLVQIGTRCDQKMHDKEYEGGHGVTAWFHPKSIKSLIPQLTIPHMEGD